MDLPQSVLFFANTDWYLYNFRLSLAERIRREGAEVILVCPDGKYAEELRTRGFSHYSVTISNRNKNPIEELRLLVRLLRIYRRERPEIAHHFTVKCILYGTLVSRLVGGIKVVNAVTGLGYFFRGTGAAAELLRHAVKPTYRSVLSYDEGHVICQNASDREELVQGGFADREQISVIRGSGVDSDLFSPEANRDRSKGDVTVLFASRLIEKKGVGEFIEAARRIHTSEEPVKFWLAGDIYPDNPSSLTAEDLNAIRDSASVRYLGKVEDMFSLLAKIDIVVLPSSYGEGTPRILLEAASMEIPLVATDIPGCRGVVEDGVNGFMIPVGDVDALVRAIMRLAKNDELRAEFGERGRRIVLEKFEESIVLDRTLRVYENLLESGGSRRSSVSGS